MLRCFIADDEVSARQRLRRLLSQLGLASVVGEAADGVSTLEQLGECQADVLLLDISMPELDGLSVAAALAASPLPTPAIVFVTAHDEHALAAFELSAFDYLVKPVRTERLSAALGKVQERRHRAPASPDELTALLSQLRTSRRGRRMAARSGAKFIVFDPERVYGIFACDHYCRLLLDGEELLLDDPLDQLQRRFDPEQFLRVHRSAIINIALLRELAHEGDRRYVAVLGDGQATRVPVSRERLPALRAALGL